MKNKLFALIIILTMLPSQTFALSTTAYDANSLTQNDQFRQELIQDTLTRKGNISFNVKNFNDSQSQKIFDYISNIIFYQSNMDIYSITMNGSVLGRKANLVINLDYRMTPEENKKVDEWIEKIMKPYLELNPTKLEIIRFVNDTIVKHVEYDESYLKNSAYYAVYNRSSLCEGYSFLTYKMLSYANIESKLISGVAGDEDHMWNLVKYNDAWYHLDVTWNDPVFIGSYQKSLSFVSHEFFMLTDAQISKDHTWDKTLFPSTTRIN